MNTVILGWIGRRALELGGIVGFLTTAYLSLDAPSQAAITRILTGEWRSLPIGQIITLLVAGWGYWQSFHQTVKPKVVTKVDGTLVSVSEKELPATTKEAVKTSAGVVVEERKGRTLVDIIGGIFGRKA